MDMSALLIPFFLLNSTCDKQRPDVSGQAASITSCCITSRVQAAGNPSWVTQEAQERSLGRLRGGRGWEMEEILGKQRMESRLGVERHPVDYFITLSQPRMQKCAASGGKFQLRVVKLLHFL